MNSFEQTFFKKYTPEWQDIRGIIHEHWLKIVNNILVVVWLFTLLPSFVYFNSLRLQEIIPFVFFEIYLYIMFIKIIYDIFDRYNDVWIITGEWVVDLDWSLFSTNMTTVKFENIEWVEVEQYWLMDSIFNKWDIVIHKIGTWEFRLPDARIPYESLDEIEKISKEKSKWKKKDRFETILEALSWVVENYLDSNGMTQNNKQKEKYDSTYLQEIKEKKWTIDLN